MSSNRCGTAISFIFVELNDDHRRIYDEFAPCRTDISDRQAQAASSEAAAPLHR
jgi:hypothetical protein